MKYLCLVYSDEHLLHSLPESPKDAECMAYAESIQGSGRMVAAEALESVQTATTVRMRNGKLSITDGPFAETKEIVAGYWIWEVKDMDEAVAWVKRCPNPMPGPSEIEIRPLYELEDFDYAMTPEADAVHTRNKAAMEGR